MSTYTISPLMKRMLLFTVLTCMVETVAAQFRLRFDFSNVDNTIAFLKKKDPGYRDVETFVNTSGVQAIIKKINASDSIARAALTKVVNDEKTEGPETRFQYEFVKNNLDAIENFIDAVKGGRQTIQDSIASLARYLPAGKSVEVTISFLLGGHSSGFTFSESDIFYIGAHLYKYDLASIINTCRHELFHNIQNLYHRRQPVYEALENDTAAQYVFYLAHNFFTEGTAEYIADLDKADPSAPNIKLQKEHALVNQYRMAENFYLADRLLLDVFKHPSDSDPGAAYSILFDWNWNNPGYVMGKYMMKVLVAEYGAETVKNYLSADPLIFIRDYINVSKSRPDIYPYHFSDEFAFMIESILKKTISLH